MAQDCFANSGAFASVLMGTDAARAMGNGTIKNGLNERGKSSSWMLNWAGTSRLASLLAGFEWKANAKAPELDPASLQFSLI